MNSVTISAPVSDPKKGLNKSVLAFPIDGRTARPVTKRKDGTYGSRPMNRVLQNYIDFEELQNRTFVAKVLDLGSGFGAGSAMFNPRFVDLVDIRSQASIGRKEKWELSGFRHFIQADATEPLTSPLLNEDGYDFVLSNCFFDFYIKIEHWGSVVKNMVNQVREGGNVLITLHPSSGTDMVPANTENLHNQNKTASARLNSCGQRERNNIDVVNNISQLFQNEANEQDKEFNLVIVSPNNSNGSGPASHAVMEISPAFVLTQTKKGRVISQKSSVVVNDHRNMQGRINLIRSWYTRTERVTV